MSHPETFFRGDSTPVTDILRFPDGFRWGSATASHQVEGNNTRNDWWLWEQLPNHIRHNDSSLVACDWWNRAEDDIALAAQLRHNALRVSLEWSRLEPRPGEWDTDAAARYRRMFRAIRDQGMEPLVCLWHFTLPQWVSGRGGFETSWTIDRYARYVDRAVQEFGDLVDWWLTMNEPMVYAGMGWLLGVWPPGKNSPLDALRVGRNLVRAHAAAYHAIHRRQPTARVSVGMHLASYVAHNPLSRASQGLARLRDWVTNQVWLRATLDGVLRPPLGLNERVGDAYDSHDFLGYQQYFTYPLAFSWRHPHNLFTQEIVETLADAGAFMGELRPEGLYTWAMWLKQFGKPIVVTENGYLEKSERERPRYLLRAIAALHRAIQEGADVRAYFHWSTVDNFEWAEGYDARFGLIDVDFATQQRTVKPSGYLYRDIAAANGIPRAMAEQVAPDLLETYFR